MSVYLHLYHGRKDPNQDLDDWGEEGPCIGPLDSWHATYMLNIRAYSGSVELFFPTHDDMIAFGGMYYGEVSLHSEPVEGADLLTLAEARAVILNRLL
jgi:hypothetical protein